MLEMLRLSRVPRQGSLRRKDIGTSLQSNAKQLRKRHQEKQKKMCGCRRSAKTPGNAEIS